MKLFSDKLAKNLAKFGFDINAVTRVKAPDDGSVAWLMQRVSGHVGVIKDRKQVQATKDRSLEALEEMLPELNRREAAEAKARTTPAKKAVARKRTKAAAPVAVTV